MIEIKNLTKTFPSADGTFYALKNVSLTINDGEIYGIIGMSGAGKSTLVRCINMLERPTEGAVLVNGCDVGTLRESELRKTRREVTMIFQGFHLLMQRTVLRNICFPLELAGVKASEAKARARELLRMVGLPDKENAYPAQLSGGQQQRVAIARALATNPKVLLCDEATSALDPKTTRDILSLIRDITVVSVFSNPKAAATRRLVFPDSAEDELDLPHDEHRLRVIFNGAPAANTPLIARMAMDKRIAANILYASTRSVGDKIYGHMLLGIPGGDEETRTAMEYLRAAENVVVEEA